MSPFLKAVVANLDAARDAHMQGLSGKDLLTTPELIEDGRTKLGRGLVREQILALREQHEGWSVEEIAREAEASPVTVRKTLREAGVQTMSQARDASRKATR